MGNIINIDLSGDKLLPHQRALINSKCKKSALICGRGAGKSYALAALVLLTLLRGRNVLVGGQRIETIRLTLYQEIKRLAQKWDIYDIITWRESPMMMALGDARVWFASYAAPDSVRGYSRVSLIACDELFLAPTNIFSIWGPCCRDTPDGVTRFVGATTPRQGSLWNVLFSDPNNDWEIIHAVTKDNPHITEEEFSLIVSGMENAEMYDQEILGKLSTDLGNAAIIKLAEFPGKPGTTNDTRVIAGLDCAEGVERDATAFVKRQGNRILEAWKINRIDHEETVRRIRESNRRQKIDTLNMDAAFSDFEYTTLKYEIRDCNQINFASAASEELKKKYGNIRAEMYFNTADWVRHGGFIEDLELAPEIKRQLCAITWHRDNQGRLLLVKKEELRAALKMSPDISDALALTHIDKWTGDDPVIIPFNNDPEIARQRRRFARMMG